MTWLRLLQGSRDGSVVRAVASHQCDLSLILIKCHVWVELLVLLLLSRFFCRYSDFPLSWKTTTSKFQFDQHILGPAWKPAKAVAVLSPIMFILNFLFFCLECTMLSVGIFALFKFNTIITVTEGLTLFWNVLILFVTNFYVWLPKFVMESIR